MKTKTPSPSASEATTTTGRTAETATPQASPHHPIHELIDVVRRLRHPTEGCPWDLEQDHKSLRPYLMEEAYEALDALTAGDDDAMREELGDVLLQVVLHAQLASERGAFDFGDISEGISDKIVTRHPHVFGDARADTSGQVLKQWEDLKLKEKGRTSVLDGVPKGLPTLLKAFRLQEKAAVVGFDWDRAQQVAEKVREEVEEFLSACQNGEKEGMEEEFGDILFSLVNLGRFLGLNAEFCLAETNAKFIRRFRAIEEHAREEGRHVENMTLAEMDAVWNELRARDRTPE